MKPVVPTYDDLMRHSRRHFLGKAGFSIGAFALSTLLGSNANAAA
ncbi:MAG: twin-arginine translocation signal domain-containing protein, partial [bacterium]